MNIVFFLLIGFSFVVAAVNEFLTGGQMEQLSSAVFKTAGEAVPLVIGLIGVMCFFLGLMKVLEEAGLLKATARLLAPLLRRLFPEVPADHPALGSMVMNVSANILGLGNAATPFGIRAMEQLEELNPHKGTATNAQVLFLAMNTASITLIPTSVIALRATVGSQNPAAVVIPTLVATAFSMVVAIVAARFLQRFFPVAAVAPLSEKKPVVDAKIPEKIEGYPRWVSFTVFAVFLLIAILFFVFGAKAGSWLIPALIVASLAYGLYRKVRIYEVFVEGAREGINIGVRIIPYLVAILVAIGMFRASGAMDMMMAGLGVVFEPLGIPVEALLMSGMRTLSGSGAFGLLTSYMHDPSVGPDSFKGILLGTIYGSSETTFYVLAVYFGAVGIRRIRHSLAAGLLADLAGLIAAVVFCYLLV